MKKNNGTMEQWNCGRMRRKQHSIFPLFQHSYLPVFLNLPVSQCFNFSLFHFSNIPIFPEVVGCEA